MKSFFFPIVIGLFSIVLIISCNEKQKTKAGKDYQFTKDEFSTSVPFIYYNNLILVSIRINNLDSLCFLFDSGFEESVIDEKTAKKLNLSIGNKTMEAVPGGDVSVAHTDSLMVYLPGLTIKNEQMAVIPLDGLYSLLGKNINGIIGHDFFTRFTTKIDFINKQITFTEPSSFKYTGTGEKLKVDIIDNQGFINITLITTEGKKVLARIKLDTGSTDVLGLNGSFVSNENLFSPEYFKIPALGSALGGGTKNYVTRLEQIEIGRYKLLNPYLGYSEDTSRKGDAGTMGNEIFKRFTVIFDYTNSQLIFEANKLFEDPYEWDKSGLFLTVSERGTLQISDIVPNSVADKAGLKLADELISINKRPVSKFTIAEIRELLLKDKNQLVFEIKRNGKSITITFMTEKYI